MEITMDRWREAQQAEREFHDKMTREQALKHYAESYRYYFFYTNVTGREILGKTIMEVGPADVPGLIFASGYKKGIIVEPLPSDNLITNIEDYIRLHCEGTGLYPTIDIVQEAFEQIAILPKGVDEIWLFNVLQHVIDPDKFLERAKQIAPVIRFFEPINHPVEIYHPHTFNIDFYKKYFGDAVQYYPGFEDTGFHTAECAFGVWRRDVATAEIPQAAQVKLINHPPVAPVSMDRWQYSFNDQQGWYDGFQQQEGKEAFKITYDHYFRFLGIQKNQQGKSILEIGSGLFPALAYVGNVGKSYIIDPLNKLRIAQAFKDSSNKPVQIFGERAEDIDFPQVDEVWMFNVYGYLLDAERVVKKAKAAAKVIRFFEPVMGADNLILRDFNETICRKQLGAFSIFPANSNLPNFHSKQCLYGVIEKKETAITAKEVIGILVTATGRFTDFFRDFYDSLSNFCPGYKKNVFLFTDADKSNYAEFDNVFVIPTKHKQWPYITLERYLRYSELMQFSVSESGNPISVALNQCDYLFHSDVDMRIVNVGPEILQPLVAVTHPLFIDIPGTFENDPRSTAYVIPQNRRQYVCGGIQGGEFHKYMNVVYQLKNNIQQDLSVAGIIAEYHDESHWNWYVSNNFDDISILPADYCYPEEINMPSNITPRIFAVDKDKNVYR